ncbi:MAG: copper amine oxidase [Thermoleophilia bacterium]|nr:copper amine oxidase [Thermoleophilia bacterium]
MKARFSTPAAIVAALAAASLIGAGCGSSDKNDSKTDSAKKTTKTSAMSGTTMSDTKTAGITTSDAATLRITLDRLLGQHMYLAVQAIERSLSGSKDAAQAGAALNTNSKNLADAIGSVYGDAAHDSFLEQWNAHNGMFVAYATGVAKGDKAGQAKALVDLDGYIKNFGEFLGTATGAPVEAVQAALKMHVDHTKTVIDAYGAKDYTKSWNEARVAYDHMNKVGDVLAGAITAQKSLDTGSTTKSAVDTRALLDEQLAEHAALASYATRAGLAGDPDFKALAAALDANTVDLSKTIGSVLGAPAEKQFLAQWRAHIVFFVNYTVATAKNDAAGKAKAAAGLADYTRTFAEFLAGPTGLPASALQEDLKMHVAGLAGAIDSYHAGDYEKAWSQWNEAYEHMYGTGDTLASGLTAKYPDKFQG